MSKQPEALQYATYLDSIFVCEDVTAVKARQIAAELRRLHEVNQELLEALKSAEKRLMVYAETCDSEWGDCRDVDELELDEAWPKEVYQARAAITKAGAKK